MPPPSFCGEPYSHHLCQILLIQIFFEHELGNTNIGVTVHVVVEVFYNLVVEAVVVEDVLSCLRTLKSALWYIL